MVVKKVVKRTKKSKIEPFVAIGLIGVIILFIGGFLVTLGFSTPPPHQWKYGDNSDAYQSEYHNYIELTETESLIGFILMNIGAFMLLLMCFIAPFARSISHEDKRLFLILGIVSAFLLVLISSGIFRYPSLFHP